MMHTDKLDIKVFDDIEVLKQLVRTWRYFSDFRLICAKIDKSEELLSILSTVSFDGDFEKKDLLPEFMLLKESWNKPYTSKTLASILKTFDIKIKIEDDYDGILKKIKLADIDPMLKFVIILLSTYKYFNKNEKTIRITTMFIFKLLNIMQTPILYPIEFINTNNLTETIDKKSTISLLKTFEDICKYGEYTIKAVYESMLTISGDIKKIKELKKFASSKYFYYIFSRIYIRITDFMEDSGIKRDKAARLLAKLVKNGYLKEQKTGKEKIFINFYMAVFLKDLEPKNYVK